MSVDESLLCSFQVSCSVYIFPPICQILTFTLLDSETSGEETKVRLRWSWCQQARHSSEEEEVR